MNSIINEETRICKICVKEKPIKSFYLYKGRPRRRICFGCNSKIYRNKSSENKKKIKNIGIKAKKKYASKREEYRRQLMIDINQNSCQKCGFADFRALHFHHKNPDEKQFGINWALQHSYGYQTLLEEAKKCEILCPNCHTLDHYSEKKYHVEKNI